MNFGYGVAVRKMGFTAPAAGKTGTSHDAWFAAYSSNLICIIWIGNDDYTDVKLSGAIAAAPIWAEFMNRAIRLPQYSDMKAFTPPPEGIQIVRIDRASNLPADESCPGDGYNAAFLVGTVPQSTCSHMGIDAQTLGNQLFGDGASSSGPMVTPGNPYAPGTPNQNRTSPTSPYSSAPPSGPRAPGPYQPQTYDPNQPAPEVKHRNAFKKLFGLGKPKDPPAPDAPQ